MAPFPFRSLLYTRELVSYEKCLNFFKGETASRLLRKVKLSSSVRWLTAFRPLTSLGRQRESVEGHQGIFGLSENL